MERVKEDGKIGGTRGYEDGCASVYERRWCGGSSDIEDENKGS